MNEKVFAAFVNMASKTVSVELVREQVNAMIRHAPSEEAREALCMFLEVILMETDNYKGFRYIGPVPRDHFNSYEREYF